MSHILNFSRIDAIRTLRRGALAALLVTAIAPLTVAAEPAKPEPAKAETSHTAGVFILVRNEAGDALKGRDQAFEDLIAARVSSASGLAVISRADAVKRLAAGEKPGLDGARVDAAFDDRTSALALAQNLGAKGILTVTLLSLSAETREYAGNGVATVNTTHALRAAWKLADAEQAAGVRGDTVVATRTVRKSEGLTETPGDLVNGLLDDAARKIAEGVRAGAAGDRDTLNRVAASAKRAKFSVGITADNLFFPELAIGKDGVLRVEQEKSPVRLTGVIVELDGAAVGTAPFATPLEVRPGIHKLRLSRDGFTPWEGVVNVSDGFTFNTALELSAAGLARWREQTRFIEGLKAGVKLTDAEITLLKAKAENLKNYGYKVEVKVDADKLPDDKSNIINVVPGNTVAVPVR